MGSSIWEPAAVVVLALAAIGLLAVAVARWRDRRLYAYTRELARVVDERTRELRAHERELEARNAQLAELNAQRSQLFANLSHEFRTPLTLILAPLRSLLDGRHGELPPAAREQGELMLRNGQRLMRLVNQVLDLARLQAGALPLERRPHDLVEFARTATLAFAPLAERRRVELRFRSARDRLPTAFDAEQLEQVIVNLLSNALKFTEPGGRVEVAVDAGDDDATIVVRDTGVGIAPDQLPRVFDRFFQADSSPTRHYEGTGIGLALARELVELHGGEIAAESTPGAGSTFAVRLPLVPAGAGAWPVPAPDPDALAAAFTTRESAPPDDTGRVAEAEDDGTAPDRTTLLVVDDNADVRAFLRSILSPTYRVIEAADGAHGLAAARAALPDLIVADVMMPELDGLALARALKDDAMTDAIPVVLLTARAAPEDQVAGYGTGADAYLLKPFDPEVLEACVASLLAQRRRLRERFRAGEAPPVAPHPAAPSALERRLRRLVEERLTDPDLTPETLAESAGLSYHQLYRALRDGPGVTPSRFIRGVRVECAAELLRRGAGSVTEVAYSVGFESLSYFSRSFHERFGAAPSSVLAAPDAAPVAAPVAAPAARAEPRRSAPRPVH